MNAKKIYTWTTEAVTLNEGWKRESWRDLEMYDGKQWDPEDLAIAEAANVDPLTINRTFPLVNMLLGQQILNQYDIMPKARTHKDGELSEILAQGIKFVMDQNNGPFKINHAFRDAVISGIGFLLMDYNDDPREEPIRVTQVPWTEVELDPFADISFGLNACRYILRRKWVDLDDFAEMFPEKRKEILEQFSTLSGQNTSPFLDNGALDFGSKGEEARRLGTRLSWVDSDRKRVRPVEAWYYKWSTGLFAIMPDGNVREISERLSMTEQVALAQGSQEIVKTSVRRVWHAMVLGDELLLDEPSNMPHSRYPFVPFLGYLDRFGFPYGVPRQIRGQNKEVNNRRSMALALMRSRQIMAAKGVADSPEDMSQIYEEAQKLDGFIVVNDEYFDKFAIRDHAALAPAQMDILQRSEIEMQEISGANQETALLSGSPNSSEAVEQRRFQAGASTASLFNNYRLGLKLTGELIVSMMQSTWTGPKVLRITDRLTSLDRFTVLNQRVFAPDGSVRIKNDISQGTYDIIISEAPATATLREKNMEQIIEMTKTAPPELHPQLLVMALELSDLPNKEALLLKAKPLLGMDPREEDLSPEELREKRLADYDAQQQAAAENAALEKELRTKEIEKLTAEIQLAIATAKERDVKGQVQQGRVELEGFKAGFESELAIAKHKQEVERGREDQKKDGKRAAKPKTDSKRA